MARFTKQERQRIVREFALRHNGRFNPALFVEEVENAGDIHPAYGWFEWDGERAAREHRLWQAREFARDLKVTFKIEEVGRNKKVRVREAAMPLVISPMQGRHDGGGYFLVDPEDPSHMAEHCRQAASSLRMWLNRWKALLRMPADR